MIIVLVLVVLVAVGGAAAIRFVGHVPERWHVDPLTAPKPGTPNSYRVAPPDADVPTDREAPVYERSVDDLAAAFDDVALADARTEVLAGSAADGFVTYVQRSALFAFPDYVSVRFIESDAGRSTLAVFSRSRYGRSDLGVNKKRIERWLAEL